MQEGAVLILINTRQQAVRYRILARGIVQPASLRSRTGRMAGAIY
jgi:hypothetical protein